ncbi:MAG: DUF5788 family protein [Methanomassiliicoccales archaeon]|nr:DUF5788 family protein [Methanomassiliicoccales archaeon]
MSEYSCVEDCLTPEERKRILSRFHSLLFWVGELVPELEELEGREVPLKDVVFRFITQQDPDEGTVRGARELSALLERKARELERDLETKEMERRTAYRVMHEALGLLRAVDELRDVRQEDRQIRAKALMAMVNDEKRWLDFVNKAKTT